MMKRVTAGKTQRRLGAADAESVPPDVALRAPSKLFQAMPPLLLAAAVAFVLVKGSSFYFTVATLVALYAINCIGLGLLYGFGGQISVAQATFYGIGAYTTAILTVRYGVPAPIGIFSGAVAAAAVGFAIGRPILRLGEFYLALATLALTQIFIVFIRQGGEFTGGPLGIAGIPPLGLTAAITATDPRAKFLVIVVALALVIAFSSGIARSRIGRALHALRLSETGAQVVGIDTARSKARIFTLSAAMSGLAGALYAHYISYISSDAFTAHFSILLLTMLFVGGLRSVWGGLVGAGFLTILTELLRGYGDNQVILSGVVLVAVLLLFPAGLVGILQGVARRLGVPAEQGSFPQPNPIPVNDAAPYRPAKRVDAPTETGQPILQVTGVRKSFGGLRVLEDINFSMARGQVTALLGANGAGKTTCFNIVSGLISPDHGDIRFDGQSIVSLPPNRRCELGIGRTFQDLRLFNDRTVFENVLVGAHSHGSHGMFSHGLRLPAARREERELAERTWPLLALVGLEHDAHRRVADLPFGHQRLVDLARALATVPRLLLLDEPVSGLSAGEIEHFENLLPTIQDMGVSVLLVEHNMKVAFGLAEHCVFLAAGSVIFAGTPEGAQKDAGVLSSYLGERWHAKK